MDGNSSDRIQFGPFEADLRTHELWKFGTRIRLVGQPFEILSILLSKPGELVTRDELRGRLWPGDTFVDFNHGLNAAVNKLRDALSDSADEPRYVETLPRRGYRFIASVQRPSAGPAASEVATEAAPSSVPVTTPIELPQQLPPQRAGRGLRFYLLGAAGLLVFVLAMLLVFKHVGRGGESSEGYAPGQKLTSLTNLPDETSEPAFSADGAYIAFRRDGLRPQDSGIFVKALGSDHLIQVTRNSRDCCPVWSPDGRFIAYSRFVNREYEIFVAPFSDSEASTSSSAGVRLASLPGERQVYTGGITPKRGELSWSPDGKTIAFGGGPGIFLLELKEGTAHRLTQPPPESEDWGPSFSADGETLLFVRSHESGFPAEIMSVPAKGGEPSEIVSEQARILGPPQWASDGKSILYSSDRGSHPGIWKVSWELRDTPVAINDTGWYPAVSRRGYRLAYQRVSRALNIWQLDLTSPDAQEEILVSSTSDTDQGPGPQFSPDGKKLAYMSDRSGSMEIWVSDRDGSNAFQLTATGGAGTPRWSPDSQSIVFDAKGREEPVIYVASLKGGPPRPLTPDGGFNNCPTFSGDGKWVYFASRRSGAWQVWKVPAQGGSASQVTTQGGHAPLESADGRYIYYAKTPYANPEIWQVPVQGGPEQIVSPAVRPSTWASWSVVDRGILFAGPSGSGRPMLGLYDSETHQVKTVGSLDVVPFWIGATRDGKTVAFDRPGWQLSQIMLVENFR